MTSLQVMGDRIYVGDLQESFHFMKYKRSVRHFRKLQHQLRLLCTWFAQCIYIG